MDSTVAKKFDAEKCPLCGQPNDCQLCTIAAYKGPCWCAKLRFPEELLAQLSPEQRNKACICLHCVMSFHRNKKNSAASQKVLPGDFYFESGLMVFTATYHLRRGYCCETGCRHCPYSAISKLNERPLPQRTSPPAA